MVDDYNLHQMLQPAKPEQIQDPATKPIDNPMGGEVYAYGRSGRTNEIEAAKEDGLRWKSNRTSTSQNFTKEVFYTREEKGVTTQFQKHLYTSHDGKYVAVHDVGDEMFAVRKTGKFSRPQVVPKL